jgi:hypothetical protein
MIYHLALYHQVLVELSEYPSELSVKGSWTQGYHLALSSMQDQVINTLHLDLIPIFRNSFFSIYSDDNSHVNHLI